MIYTDNHIPKKDYKTIPTAKRWREIYHPQNSARMHNSLPSMCLPQEQEKFIKPIIYIVITEKQIPTCLCIHPKSEWQLNTRGNRLLLSRLQYLSPNKVSPTILRSNDPPKTPNTFILNLTMNKSNCKKIIDCTNKTNLTSIPLQFDQFNQVRLISPTAV